ncbi:EAL domain-containing protein [Gilvimarinus agarilyticus]|uniref:putative bifunctional diguanylate cyclase/phosphodiesterase n=1 Tax=unclassified Gilvimarinus TaxID=2642066 RepID=UPI001C082FD8|nr:MULTISPECIES: EAL domain-containing protein [unclassified Gilvimarinus]MBU2884335.1 EAL domain-containing protein [Gilvimarinus agarilyticus]MDO6569471.1 EAL domain-containing protein [Gilvimarinus sp. 2_MG-2023]MDO6748420.1 EAL domain-containing protein [Gilvimarinus sp. 1_MG-2023]
MASTISILLLNGEQSLADQIGAWLDEVAPNQYSIVLGNMDDDGLICLLSEDYQVALFYAADDPASARELLDSMKSHFSPVPVLVLSNSMNQVLDREAVPAGAADYLALDTVNAFWLERALRYAIERKRTEHHLARLAHHDPLTDIPNRVLFRDRLENALRVASREKARFALMFIDLDDFKVVNDRYGHDIGDGLIRLCAERLQSLLRRSDSMARMGGDEFTLLLLNVESSSGLAHLAVKIIEQITTPYEIGGYHINVGCSLGIASYPEAGHDADTLLKSADLAMYQAKQVEGSNFRFFTEEMNRDVRYRLRLEEDLRRAVENRELYLEYQPRFAISTGKVVALEALLRWNHPQKGILSAHNFISIAEDTGLIFAIGYWAIRRACADLQRLKRDVGIELKMAVNLSARQFRDESMVQHVANIFNDTGVDPNKIEFELTETALMENIDMVSLCMRPLSYFGVTFALDDFGTGSSSFLHLQRLPITALKIDSQFMTDLLRRRSERRLVSAMINLAHNLGKAVVAEGVENASQQKWLIEEGCDQMQGYFLSAPQSYDRLHKVIADLTLTDVSAAVPPDGEES